MAELRITQRKTTTRAAVNLWNEEDAPSTHNLNHRLLFIFLVLHLDAVVRVGSAHA
jgi:hypothetical protein